MQLPPLSTDLIIIAILLGIGLYGLFAGKQRLRILILSVYVGIVLAEQMTDAVAPFLGMLSREYVSWLLLGLPIVIFGVFGVSHSKHHEKGAAIANIIVGILTGALIVSSALLLLPTGAMAATNEGSFIASQLTYYHLWVLGLLPAAALLLGFIKRDKH